MSDQEEQTIGLPKDSDIPTQAKSLHAQVEAMTDAMRSAIGEDDPEIDEIGDMFHEVVDEWERQKRALESQS